MERGGVGGKCGPFHFGECLVGLAVALTLLRSMRKAWTWRLCAPCSLPRTRDGANSTHMLGLPWGYAFAQRLQCPFW